MKKQNIISMFPLIAACLLMVASILLCLSAFCSNQEAIVQSFHSTVSSIGDFLQIKVSQAQKMTMPSGSRMDDTIWQGLDEGEKALLAFQRKDRRYLNQREKKLYTQLQQFHALLRDDMTEYEIARTAYDYVCSQCIYNHDAAENDDGYTSDCASEFGALVDGYAVCAGYARGVKFLLDSTPLKCLYVTGMVRESGHAWNLIRIDGKYYHADATWDDVKNGANTYRYFLKSDQFMSSNRTWSKVLFPSCPCPYMGEDRLYRNIDDAEEYITNTLLHAQVVELSTTFPLPDFNFLPNTIHNAAYAKWSSNGVYSYCIFVKE